MPEYSMIGPYNTLRASLPLCGDASSRPEQSPKKITPGLLRFSARSEV